MTTYRYASPENDVVHVIDDDGKSRFSMLASGVPSDKAVLPYVPQPPTIPNSVSMRQARLALLGSGLLDAVELAIQSAGPAAKIEWEYAQEVQRSAGLVPAMAAALGMTDAQIDALFLQASAL